MGGGGKAGVLPIDKHVGSRVRARRKILGLSQEALGILLSISYQQVQKYEKGVNRIGASRLQEVARILEVPIGFFFEEVPHIGGTGATLDEAPSLGYASRFPATADGLALTQAFMR